MKRLLFALTVTAALAVGTVTAKETWIPFSKKVAIRAGSFEFLQGEKTKGVIATALVRVQGQDGKYEFSRRGVRLTDCDRGYGALIEYDLTNNKYISHYNYVSEGGSVGSNIADALCAAAAEEQTRTDAEAQGSADVAAFAADPRHSRFEEVRELMADLIDAATARGETLGLEQAYAQACRIRDRANGQSPTSARF